MFRQFRIFVLILLLIPISFLVPQDRESGKERKSRPTFRLPVNVIAVHVTVNNAQGNPVTDLQQKDFRIFEDGKAQAIQTFSMESYEPIPSKEPRLLIGGSRQHETSANPSRPRMISLVIDDITASSRDYFPLVEGALIRFLEDDVGPDDKVALLAGSGRAQYGFTDDKASLLDEARSILGKLSLNAAARSACPILTDLQAQRISENRHEDISDMEAVIQETMRCMHSDALIPDASYVAVRPGELSVQATQLKIVSDMARSLARSEASRQHQESEYRTSILLHTLRQHIRTLRHYEGAKSLILFSDGFLSDENSHISFALQDVVTQALSAGVVLNVVDIRGLYTAAVPASEKLEAYTPDAANYRHTSYLEDQSAQESPLHRMTIETAGLFSRNSNDLYAGLRRIVHRHSVYYVLTYAAPMQKPDGRFHRIQVEIARDGLELSHRKGYYAPREELTFEHRKKEDILEALKAPDNLNEIPIYFAYNYYQEEDARYAVSLSTHVDIRPIPFIEEDARRKNLIHLVVVAYDETDRFVDGIERSIDFKLTDESYPSLLQYGIDSKVTFHLPMGRYKVKAVVREGTQGKMGSATKAIDIP